MNTLVTLEIPEDLAREAQAVAERTGRRFEDVLTEWLNRLADDLPVESLSDERLLELCNLQLSEEQQGELSDLLARNRETQLQDQERENLERLMNLYRKGMVRKAEALKVAVQRGLIPPLTN